MTEIGLVSQQRRHHVKFSAVISYQAGVGFCASCWRLARPRPRSTPGFPPTVSQPCHGSDAWECSRWCYLPSDRTRHSTISSPDLAAETEPGKKGRGGFVLVNGEGKREEKKNNTRIYTVVVLVMSVSSWNFMSFTSLSNFSSNGNLILAIQVFHHHHHHHHCCRYRRHI